MTQNSFVTISQTRLISSGKTIGSARKMASTSSNYFSLTNRTLIRVTGKDRLQVVNNFFTNQIKELPESEGIEGIFPNDKGKTLAHAFVYVNKDALWIESWPGQGQTIVQHIDRYVIGEDARFEILDHRGLLTYSVLEPSIDSAASRRNDLQVEISNELICFGSRVVSGGSKIFYGDKAHIDDLANDLLGQGYAQRSTDQMESDRIRMGYPMFGVDFSVDNLPQELGRDGQLISFVKGCYLGQETIARLDALGHVNKKVVSLKATAPTTEPANTVQLPIVLESDGKSIGKITSLTCLESAGTWHAIATLRVSHTSVGATVPTPIGEFTVV